MKYRWIAATLSLLVAWIAGCAQAAGNPSTLERYDDLRPGLAWVTDQSARVSSDTGVLSADVQRGHVARARLEAERLKRDSQAFALGSGQYGNSVHALQSHDGPAPVREYLDTTWRTLSADWYEGETLARLADVVWADPLAMIPTTPELISRLQREAQHYASVAVSSVHTARLLRLRYYRLFRYVPVEKQKKHD